MVCDMGQRGWDALFGPFFIQVIASYIISSYNIASYNVDD